MQVVHHAAQAPPKRAYRLRPLGVGTTGCITRLHGRQADVLQRLSCPGTWLRLFRSCTRQGSSERYITTPNSHTCSQSSGSSARSRRPSQAYCFWWEPACSCVQCEVSCAVQPPCCSCATRTQTKQHSILVRRLRRTRPRFCHSPSITAAGTACSPSALNCLPPAGAWAAAIDAKRGWEAATPGRGEAPLLQLAAPAAVRRRRRPGCNRCRCRARVAGDSSSSQPPLQDIQPAVWLLGAAGAAHPEPRSQGRQAGPASPDALIASPVAAARCGGLGCTVVALFGRRSCLWSTCGPVRVLSSFGRWIYTSNKPADHACELGRSGTAPARRRQWRQTSIAGSALVQT